MGELNGSQPGRWRPVISPAIPLTFLLTLASAALTYAFTSGASSSAEAAFKAGVKDQLARLESDFGKDLKQVQTSLTERVERLEAGVAGRFEGIDRRGDSRMAAIAVDKKAADQRDEQFAGDLTKLDLRLTRIEALREFNANNGGPKR